MQVQYIDYGNTETVKQSFLREMLPEFGKIHCVALYCELHDIVPNTLDNKWPVPVLEYMHELMVNAWCQMNIIKMEDGDLAQVVKAFASVLRWLHVTSKDGEVVNNPFLVYSVLFLYSF